MAAPPARMLPSSWQCSSSCHMRGGVAAHGFAPLQYAASHVPEENQILNRVLNPLSFLVHQLGMLAPIALAAIPLVGPRWRWREVPAERRFDRAFLLTMVLGNRWLCIWPPRCC